MAAGPRAIEACRAGSDGRAAQIDAKLADASSSSQPLGALYYFKGPVLLIAAIVVFWLWLCRRYPRTMWFVTIFLTALLGKRRR